MGNLILARFYKTVKTTLGRRMIMLWRDSRMTLAWIPSGIKGYEVFVENPLLEKCPY